MYQQRKQAFGQKSSKSNLSAPQGQPYYSNPAQSAAAVGHYNGYSSTNPKYSENSGKFNQNNNNSVGVPAKAFAVKIDKDYKVENDPKYPCLAKYCSCCYSRCTKVRCAICTVIWIIVIAVMAPIVNFKAPGFEAKIDTLNNLDIGANFIPATLEINALFDLVFDNPNAAGLTILDVDTRVVFQELEVKVFLYDEAFLEKKSVTTVPANLDIDVTFDNIGAVFDLASTCLSDGIAIFTLFTEAQGQYIGITSNLELPPAPFEIDCGIFRKPDGSLDETSEKYKKFANIRDQAQAMLAAQQVEVKSSP